MAEKFSLKDHLFNAASIGQLAAEYAAVLPRLDAEAFTAQVLSGFGERELLQRLDWIADCLEPHLANDFPAMADQIEAAMPPPLDPALEDDDFGRFIHAVPGVLAVRHGASAGHRDRALDLLHAATQRFSMEFYVRPFLNRWPDAVLERLHVWADDPNYHVRRLVSEGTRPRLPWARAVTLNPDQTLPLLDRLHGDPTRYVTRSVANHLNDISKTAPDLVLERLVAWQASGRQTGKELAWMTRNSLRTLIRQGHKGAMAALGYRADVDVHAQLDVTGPAQIGGALEFFGEVASATPAPVLVDYVLWLGRANGELAPKVFKLKTGTAKPGAPFKFRKTHRLKGDATTFRLYPGPARLGLQVNGRVVAEREFALLPARPLRARREADNA